MNDESSAENPEQLPSEEEQKDALREISDRMAAALGGKEHGDSSLGEDTQRAMLWKLLRLSDRLARRGKKRWTPTDQELWDQLLDACSEMETESLRREGVPAKGVQRLIRREWAMWDPASECFVTKVERPPDCNAVPVVVVQRDAGFKIHDEVLNHLWDHPLLADDHAVSEAQDPRTVFDRTLKKVELIERKHDLHDWDNREYIPLIAEQDGPDRSAAVCSLAALDMLIALVPGGTGQCDFFNDEDPPPETENLAWLTEAKKGARLWQMLNAAVELGQALQHYKTFADSSIEKTIRRMHTAFLGKQVTVEGKAVEQIIKCFLEADGGKPTSKNLLKWLGGEVPHGAGAPLKVDHRLWGSVLAKVTWEGFKSLVKGANIRGGCAVSPPTEADQ